jgi:glyoxylase-like metal-dependent hydrolase (beta-lactamase superfamily II)
MSSRLTTISLGFLLAVFTGASAFAASPAAPAPVASPRIYVMDCGTITNARVENFGLTYDEVSNVNFADMCFLVVHPKGALLWDTGLPDRLAGKPLMDRSKSLSQFKTNTLAGQLAEIGYSPANIQYLALSHYHDDHSGNANLFAAHSTWLVAKPDWDAMFPGDGKAVNGHEDFDQLKTAKTVFVTDNYDVFGDGSVRIRNAFGHTPGSIVLVVKLKNTGNVILAGDLWHYMEELKLHKITDREAKTEAPQSRAKIEKLAGELNAQIWIAHNMDLWRKLKHSPAYYD